MRCVLRCVLRCVSICKCVISGENIGFEIEEHRDDKELSFYEIDRESKRYVFCPEGVGENGPEFGENL